MFKTEQGAQCPGKLVYLLARFILFYTLCLPNITYADTAYKTPITHPKDNAHLRNIIIIYSADSKLQSDITQSLTGKLIHNKNNTIITTAFSKDKKITTDKSPELIVGIGIAGIQSADKLYPKTDKLYIATDPGKHIPDTNSGSKNAVLFMTQSYCRQIQFIKLLNKNWKTISLLNSQEKPLGVKKIQQCTKEYNVNLYTVNITEKEQLSDGIKDALYHSDVLLALPNKYIYNRKTVKNILLTSYRYRNPVIAFSQNFVNAGALASIHSNTEQIAESAKTLIDQYFDLDHQFIKAVNYPKSFDISINKQVFRALDLPIPDIDKLKQTLEYQETDK